MSKNEALVEVCFSSVPVMERGRGESGGLPVAEKSVATRGGTSLGIFIVTLCISINEYVGLRAQERPRILAE
jgi:hypothetical protein